MLAGRLDIPYCLFAVPSSNWMSHSWAAASIDLDHSESARFRLQPVPAIYNAESGAWDESGVP